MLSNPPYGKSWKSDLERVGGKSGIKDPRFPIDRAGDPEYSLVARSFYKFYKPKSMRALEEIRADMLALEKQTEGLLEEIIGGGASVKRAEAGRSP